MATRSTRTKRLTYETLRSALIERGTNLKRFAEENDIPITSVYYAAKGKRNGIKSVKIQKALEALAT
jgi:predicted transcriptional regulator